MSPHAKTIQRWAFVMVRRRDTPVNERFQNVIWASAGPWPRGSSRAGSRASARRSCESGGRRQSAPATRSRNPRRTTARVSFFALSFPLLFVPLLFFFFFVLLLRSSSSFFFFVLLLRSSSSSFLSSSFLSSSSSVDPFGAVKPHPDATIASPRRAPPRWWWRSGFMCPRATAGRCDVPPADQPPRRRAGVKRGAEPACRPASSWRGSSDGVRVRGRGGRLRAC